MSRKTDKQEFKKLGRKATADFELAQMESIEVQRQEEVKQFQKTEKTLTSSEYSISRKRAILEQNNIFVGNSDEVEREFAKLSPENQKGYVSDVKKKETIRKEESISAGRKRDVYRTGSVIKTIWVEFDKGNTDKDKIAEVTGAKRATVNTQFYHWKKARGK